jgi:hypothetical protein
MKTSRRIFTSLLVAVAGALTANAADNTTATNGPTYAVTVSTYTTQHTRDPFTIPGPTSQVAKPSPIGPLVFRLDGILYQANDPAASVNGRLVRLNKTVTLTTGSGDVQVKAVEITREKVVLEVAGQKVELKISSSK